VSLLVLLALGVAFSPAAKGAELRVLAFAGDGGGPASGLVVLDGGRELGRTDENGLLALDLDEAVLHLALAGEGIGRVELGVFHLDPGGMEVQVTVFADGRAPRVAVEGGAAQHASPQAAAPDAQKLFSVGGRVLHADTGKPLAGVRLVVRGQVLEAVSDDQGRFQLELPEGRHDISAFHADFATATRSEVPVGEGIASPELVFEMVPVSFALEDLHVRVPRLVGTLEVVMEERRTTAQVKEVLGAEQISKSGDADAAAALKRATGITVVGGKYVYVRGLGERYSCTLLDGATLPSPEPERRVVPLDMFPAAVIESLVIQKTYSPDLPGEFGGGAVLMRTRAYPRLFQAELQVGTRYVWGTTFAEGWRPRDGAWHDFLGMDLGHRALPDKVREAADRSPLVLKDMFSGKGYTAEELAEIGRALPNRWGMFRSTIPPDIVINGNVGDSFELGRFEIGYWLAGLYDSAWDGSEKQLNTYVLGADGVLEQANAYRFEETTGTVTLGGILTAGASMGKNHRLVAKTLLDRITDDQARVYGGYNVDSGNQIKVWKLSWEERMLFAQQLAGEHHWGEKDDFELRWRYHYSRADRIEPDRREIRYDLDQGTGAYLASGRSDGNSRIFSDVADASHEAALDATWKTSWAEREVKLQGGLALLLKDRQVNTRRFYMRGLGPLAQDPTYLSNPPEVLFQPAAIGLQGYVLSESTRATDNYQAEQRLLGAYVLLDLPFAAAWRLAAGVRLESSEQSVDTFELFAPEKTPVRARLDTLDWMPSATLSYELTEDMPLRLGASRTLSRPDFRELSPMTFTDVIGGGDVFGNPDLKSSSITNLDLRWEWYLGEGEALSAAGFLKLFDLPIETVIAASADTSTTFVNADSAFCVGLELDFRKSLRFVSEALSDFFLAGNLAWIMSRVDLPEGGMQTSQNRALQGQSPYAINLQLGYENPDIGTNVSILYHVFGPRIAKVGILGAPDIYEQPFHQLDLVAAQKLRGDLKLSFKIKNLLDLPARMQQGGKNTELDYRGRVFSVALGYSF
jgi:outer membrane receptor protein involved in Fe transport